MTDAAALLTSGTTLILDDAIAALDRGRTPHYDVIDAAEARHQLGELLAIVERSVEGHDPSPLVAYAARIAQEQFESGCDISEVHGAFNALEEALWRRLTTSVTGEDLIEAIGTVTTVLAAGRDALARTYVTLVSATTTDDGATTRVSAGEAGDAIVRVDVTERVGTLTLSDRHGLNVLGARMTAAIIDGLEQLRTAGVRVVILRAAPGMRVWSAGHDVHELPRGRRDPLAYNDPLERALRAIRAFPCPVIAMVHGSVWGGAFDLVLSCDLVVADESASFAITPVNIGLPYNTTGLLHFLGRLPLNLVKEMFFTAAPLDAARAKEWLVVNHLVPESDLDAFCTTLAEQMASKAPLAVAVIKEQLRVLTDFQPVAAQVYERIQGLRRDVYDSRDYLEGLAAFTEKRPPAFEGS